MHPPLSLLRRVKGKPSCRTSVEDGLNSPSLRVDNQRMDRRVLVVFVILAAGVLGLQASRRTLVADPVDLGQTLEVLRRERQFIGDRIPDRCMVGYRRAKNSEDRRPWKHRLSCHSDKQTITEITLEAQAGSSISQAGPIRIRSEAGCYPEGLKKFVGLKREPWPHPNGCLSLSRPIGDGLASVSCCPGEESFVVTVQSQLSEVSGGVFEGLERGIRSILDMRETTSVPEEMLRAIYSQRIDRLRGELEDFKIRASARNVPLIDSLLDGRAYDLLRRAYAGEANPCSERRDKPCSPGVSSQSF